MLRYAAIRILKSIPVIVIAAFIVFAIMLLVPGDPALMRAGPDAKPDEVAAVRRDMGLDRSFAEQFLRWSLLAVRGDLGKSFLSRVPVSELLANRIVATLELAIAAVLVAAATGIVSGVIAAMRSRSRADWSISIAAAITIGIPDFWVATLGILIFAVWLGVLPPGGYVDLFAKPAEGLAYLILPVVALAARPAAVLSRFARAAVLDVAREEMVWTARAKGLTEWRVVTRHIVPNALIPILTVLAVQFGQMLSAAVIVETVFAWPGLGSLLVGSILGRDYVVVQAVMLFLVMAFVFINLVADLLYARLDPRIRIGAGR
jgi:ABC-type dipeptide/oligopeptide/nickel transport system permease component